MATGGEVQGQCPGMVGSEDLDQLKCQPCLEDGNLHEVVGMCIDCQDYLCSQCFKIHNLPKPLRNHQLLDKEQMLQSQIRTSPKDACTEKCSVHEDEIIKYYCTTHTKLGCTACITLDHTTCKGVQYIPHEAKKLANHAEYRQVKNQLKSALEAFEKVAEKVKMNAEDLETSCKESLEKMKKYRKKVEEAFDKIEAKLVEQAKAIKSKEIKELAAIGDKYKKAHKEVQAALAKIQALQNSKQNCSLYTEMMRTKDKLKSMEVQIKEAEVDESYRECQIKFSPNQETLDSLQNSETFGILAESDKGAKINLSKGIIVSAKHACDLNMKTGTDKTTCVISGLVILPDGRLVLADNSENCKIKTVNVQSGQVLAELKLSYHPWDVAALNNNKVAVTLPMMNKVAVVTVGDNNLSIDRYLNVSGTCYGVDFRNDKLAVSFISPHKVQVLNLEGTIFYTISAEQQGHTVFCYPYHLTYGQDDTTLYVSNCNGKNVVNVKLDATVVSTYTDSELIHPLKPVVDKNGNVYVCSKSFDQVHQISRDCKKIQVLLTEADGLSEPYSICLSEKQDKLYVGMCDDSVKMYKTECRPE